jgi:DNA-binding transcriptional MerR regulator
VSGGDSEPMADQPHLSIGEVLSLLRSEFPEITISKIRFLESQGLIAPERTPSGYRKFYEADVERLRWILQQQKDHYLPLKVIREKLDDGPAATDAAVAFAERLDGAPAQVEPADEPSGAAPEAPLAARTEAAVDADVEAPRAAAVPAVPVPAARVAADAAVDDGPADDAAAAPVEPAPAAGPPPFADAGPPNRFTRAELARRSGLKEHEIRELEAHGLLPRPPDGGEAGEFDDDALAVAHLARSFARHGIEPRHLKMYKHFAEREAALYESVVMPLLRQRNPQARRQAQEVVAELARLGRALRTAMLRSSLQGPLGE